MPVPIIQSTIECGGIACLKTLDEFGILLATRGIGIRIVERDHGLSRLLKNAVISCRGLRFSEALLR